MSRFQIGTVVICLIINMIDGFDVLAMAFTAPQVASEWELGAAELGVLFSAGLAGMTLGSLFLGPLGDRVGRRMMVLYALVVITVGMFWAAVANGVTELALARVLTGLGIGAILPSINTLVAEYTSLRRREFAISVMQVGYPIGATVGGVIAAIVISEVGWRGVFIMGGAVSLLMIPVMAVYLPESLDFLFLRQPKKAIARINSILAKMARSPVEVLSRSADDVERGTDRLLAPEVRKPLVLLCMAFFMVMFSFYFLLSWTPNTLVQSGLGVELGISGGVLMNVGGIVGATLLGVLAYRVGALRLLALYMAACVLVSAGFGYAIGGSLAWLLVLAFAMGFMVFGSMVGLYAVTPQFFSPAVRTTGTGIAIGVGRCGAIVGPYLAGLALAAGWSTDLSYLVFTLPLLASMVCVLLLRRS